MSDLMVNNSAQIRRSPQLIATEINNIKSQTRKMVLYNSIEIGRRLVEAKSLMNHGEWGEWLEKSVDYSQRTANNLMRIFDEYAADQITLLTDNAKSQALAILSYTQAVALLGIPEKEREQFIEDHDIDSMSTRELQQAIKDREQAIKEKEEALKKLENVKNTAVEKAEEARRLLEEKQKAESHYRGTERLLRETQADVKMLQEELKKQKDEASKDKQKFEKSIDNLKLQISEAQATGDTEKVEELQETLAQTDTALKDANRKIAELEQQLKDKPIEATAVRVVEKIPEDIEKELNELRKKSQGNATTLKFSIFFDELVKKFKDLLGTLAEIKEVDEDVYEKYRNATTGLIGKMTERL